MKQFLGTIIFLTALLLPVASMADGEEFCEGGQCSLSKAELDAIIDRAFNRGFYVGLEVARTQRVPPRIYSNESTPSDFDPGGEMDMQHDDIFSDSYEDQNSLFELEDMEQMPWWSGTEPTPFSPGVLNPGGHNR